MPKIKSFDVDEAVAKAKTLFQKKGFAATSMQDIVDTLGLSRSSIYDTFGDKQQLYLKTLETYCTENAYRLEKLAATTEDPLAFIHAIFDGVIKDIKIDKEKKGCFVVNALIETDESNLVVYKTISASNETFEAMLGELVSRAQLTGQIKTKESSKLLGKYLLNVINGIRVYAKGNVNIQDIKSIVGIALKTLH